MQRGSNARVFGTISNGISIQAATGVPTEALHKTISIAIRGSPEIPSLKRKRARKN
jgi:hypothetical protein